MSVIMHKKASMLLLYNYAVATSFTCMHVNLKSIMTQIAIMFTNLVTELFPLHDCILESGLYTTTKKSVYIMPSLHLEILLHVMMLTTLLSDFPRKMGSNTIALV